VSGQSVRSKEVSEQGKCQNKGKYHDKVSVMERKVSGRGKCQDDVSVRTKVSIRTR
jgi:hypothetical protein